MTSNEQLTHNLYKEIFSDDQRVFNREFCGDFLNWGYWTSETESQIQACQNLVELVLDSIPTLEGQTLEVGCGVGGVTQMIAERIEPELITAINILDSQLEECRQKLPRATFLNMDAAAMSFPDATFRNVVSVEAAHHFSSRADFFRGVLRVLEPGGHLALCDIIGYPLDDNRRSHVADPRAYQELLLELGFCEVRVTDITADSAHAHADFVMAWLAKLLEQGRISEGHFELGGIGRIVRLALSPFYIVARARKPIEGHPRWRGRRNAHIDAYMRKVVVKSAEV